LDILHEVKLDFEKDMTICKYIDGERQYYVPDKSETKISKNLASKCFDQGYSCQFYQPQRYVDGLVELNAALESYFGCLAGSSAYLTPPFSQALPPHHDDVDVFIIQVGFLNLSL
jgi:lysine-specific demethylase/histidyl-hydroxylase NO66